MADQRNGGISWTSETWNPIRGCSRVNASCVNCYAEAVAIRFSGKSMPYHGLVRLSKKDGKPLGWNGKVRFVEDHLTDPLRWKRPRRIFVNSMSDLFHENLPFTTIAAIFGVMAAAHQHTFQVLTKRPARMREWFEWVANDADGASSHVQLCLQDVAGLIGTGGKWSPTEAWPLPNVWIGTSVGNQEEADAFIPDLLEVPAAVHWVSYEPAHGPIDFTHIACEGEEGEPDAFNALLGTPRRWGYDPQKKIDWLVCGGESGPGARPFDVAWARSVIKQCREHKTPCFIKQLGSEPVDMALGLDLKRCWTSAEAQPVRDRKGGDPDEWPEDLRVREYPA